MIYAFEDCELDAARIVLLRGGEEKRIEPQVFDLLVYLIAQRGRVVPKEELLDEVWGDRFVSESSLSTRIKSARQAVGDDGSRQAIIRTAHGKGYEFIADVRELAEEPAVRGLDRVPRVPGAVQGLIGRTDLLKELAVQLEASRLITLVGTGGVGKTSLAYELARMVEFRYRDGVFIVELVAVLDPSATSGALATALDVHPRQHDSVEDAVVDLLRPRQALLVLDNCEHLLDPVASIVDRVLRLAPDVSILATSREPLAFPSERVWPVEPLPVALDADAPIDVLLAVPAVKLFVERATAVDPRFALDPQNASAVVEICQRLDGIPLAIELAAARAQAIDVTDIAGLLDERFRLLKGVRRGVDPRHQTLEDAVRWSYDLLSDHEQHLFAELSAFAGPFDLSTAEAVCAVDEQFDMLAVLTRLAECSMLAVRRPTGGGTRYEMLDTLRAYGRSRLDDQDSIGLFRRHARHYAELSEDVRRGLCTDAEPSVVLRATSGFADLRAAQRFALQAGDFDHALGVIVALREYAMRTMRYEALSWADEALADGTASGHPLHATVRGVQAYSAWVRGEFDRSLELAADVAREEHERDLEPSGLAERAAANVLLVQGDIAGGVEATDRQLELATASGDQSRLAHACYMRSVLHSALGEFDEALNLAEQAKAIGSATGSPTDLASGWAALGYAAHDELTEALAAFAESGRIARQAHNRWMSAFALTESSALLLDQGITDDACEGLAEVVDVWHRAGEWSQQWLTLTRCVIALATIGRPELATQVIGAIETRAVMGAPPVIARLRDRALTTTDQLQTMLGPDRYEELYKSGIDSPIADVVHRTRAALLGMPVDYS